MTPAPCPFVAAVAAEADPLEAVAGRDDPRIVHGPAEAAAKIFEDSGVPGGLSDEVVERFVAAGDNAGRGDIVAENAAIHHLGEERPLRDEFREQVREVFCWPSEAKVSSIAPRHHRRSR